MLVDDGQESAQPSNGSAVCRVEKVTKSFGRTILQDVSLELSAGELLSIRGASGSGKSTLLNILGLLDQADSGRIELFGRAAPGPGSRSAMLLRRHRIGYLFQSFVLIDTESVDATLRLAQRYALGSATRLRQVREAALDRVGLGGMGKQRVFELSGGEQQRVAVARLLVKGRDLVLADEPTGSLDPMNRDAVLSMLRDVASAGAAVVVVTHDQTVIDRCDRLLSLPNRRLPATA